MDMIVEQLRSTLSPEMIDTISQNVDEPRENVEKALNALFPILISAVIQKQENEPNFGVVEHITTLLKEQALWDGGNITTDYVGIRNIIMGEGEQAHQSTRFIALIFEEKTTQLTNAVADYAKIKIESAHALTILAGTLVIAVLTKKALDNNFLPAAFFKSLQSQKNHILSLAPLSLLAILGLKYPEKSVHNKNKNSIIDLRRNNMAKIIILTMALLIILFLLLRSCISSDDPPSHSKKRSYHTKTTAKKSSAKLGAMHTIKLPDDTTIQVPKYGMENKLVALLADPKVPVVDSPWFPFDRLRFEPNSASLSPRSDRQLESIAKILNAFPSAQILIGGFTDATGTKQINNQLSTERALNVKNRLVAFGVKRKRIHTKGYGDKRPLATNETTEGRAENRRAGILVIKK